MLITERPWYVGPLAFFARQQGKYTRPITGAMIDIRVEDFIPPDIMRGSRAINIIGRLPDIQEAGQIGMYLLSMFGEVRKMNQAEAIKLAQSGDFLVLPDSPESDLWQLTRTPWWEYVVVLDRYQGYIKAPHHTKVREGEPTPEQTDEMIDNYAQNRSTLNVLAPTTLAGMTGDQITESYRSRLQRI